MTLEQRPGGDEEASQQPAGEALPVRRRAGAKALRAQGARVPGRTRRRGADGRAAGEGAGECGGTRDAREQSTLLRSTHIRHLHCELSRTA